MVANLSKADITEIAAKTPEQILRVPLNLQKGANLAQIKEVAAFLQLKPR